MFHQERMEKFIKANYAGIHNVTFKDNYEIDPLGGIEVLGITTMIHRINLTVFTISQMTKLRDIR